MPQALAFTEQKNRRKSSALNEFIKKYMCNRKEKIIKYAKELKKNYVSMQKILSNAFEKELVSRFTGEELKLEIFLKVCKKTKN